MRDKVATPDATVAAIAAEQHGVVSSGQLIFAGVSRSGIARRVRSGRLHRLHRGVYAVGYSGASREGRWMAAVLACGEGAVLSHAGAAALWDLLKPIEGRRHGIPVTTPARTIGFKLRPRVVTDGTRGDPESDFLRFCRRRGLPRPEVNAPVGPWHVDFLWRSARLAVERDLDLRTALGLAS